MDLKEELIGRAHELKPVIAARAHATEKNRAPLDETVKDLCDAGFMQMLVPKRYGGHELHVDSMAEVSRIISSACVSTGWVTSFYIGHNYFHALFPKACQDELFGDRPWQLMSGSLAPTARVVRAPGGYELQGEAPWSSGCVHADYILWSSLLIEEGAPPKPLYLLTPRDQVDIVDNWDVAGACGTGSHNVRINWTFVPESHTVDLQGFLTGTTPGGALHSNPMYRTPGPAVKYIECMAVLNGALRGAAEQFLQQTQHRVHAYTGTGAATKPSVQMRLGRTFAALDGVDELVNGAVDRVMAYDGNGQMSVEERALLRSRVGLVVQMSADGIGDILKGAGGNAFRDTSSLQRFYRDANVLRSHAVLDNDTATEARGRVLLGMDPGAMV